jgi:hypothetical protein
MIYGTIQGAHNWYETLSKTYKDLGYTNLHVDPCVWFKKENGNYTITDTYTDNVFGASNNNEEEEIRVQQDLKLGTIQLIQHPYWEHILNCFYLEHITPRNMLLPIRINLDNNMSSKTDSEKNAMDDKSYQLVLGSVMWGQLTTCPDLSFSVSLLTHFQANPGIEH